MNETTNLKPMPGEIWELIHYGITEIWYITDWKPSRPKYPFVGKRNGIGAKTSYKLGPSSFKGGRKIGEFDVNDVADRVLRLSGKEITFLQSVLTAYATKDQSDDDKHRAHKVLGKLAGV